MSLQMTQFYESFDPAKSLTFYLDGIYNKSLGKYNPKPSFINLKN